jgi:hypothetical protein
MGSMQMRALGRRSAGGGPDAASSSHPLDIPTDPWGRGVPARESEDEEIERLLLPVNWLCVLLEQMARSTESSDQLRATFDELMARLRRNVRSDFVRERLDHVARQFAAGRAAEALTALRTLAA